MLVFTGQSHLGCQKNENEKEKKTKKEKKKKRKAFKSNMYAVN